MSTKYKAKAQIPLTAQFFNQITSQKDLFDEEYQYSQKKFDSSDDIEYYILSTLFIKEWKALVELVSEQSGPDTNKKFILPAEMNSDLISQHLTEFKECTLKEHLQEGVDYLIINRKTMDILELYEGLRIPRRAYFYGVNKMIQRFPIKFQFIFISSSRLSLLQSTAEDEILSLHKALAYKNETVQDLLNRMVEYSKLDRKNRSDQHLHRTESRIYVGNFPSYEDYSKNLKSATSTEASPIEPPGEELRKDVMIGDLNFYVYGEKLPVMVIQLQENKWVYKTIITTKSQDYCQCCRRRTKLIFPCRCKQVQYCSQQCRDRDWKYHIKSCSTQLEQDNEEPKFQFTQNSKYGLVGLQNLGNTCYLNSALQCLLHTSLLTKYFVDRLYLDEINLDNPIGSKGQIVKSYAKFVQKAMITEESSIGPFKFKYIVGKTKDIFSGYEQHDSQQFLLFVLDTLHQDINRVLKKPYTNSVENKGRPDYEVAKQSWLTYLKRNQSFINDLMGGQYRSEVKCPDCKNISVTFDPYLIFSVPIPSTNQVKSINLYVFFANYQRQTLKMTLKSKNNLSSQLYDDIIQKVNDKTIHKPITRAQIKLFILGFNGGIRQVQADETIDRLINEKQYNQSGEERQLFCLQFTDEELSNIESKRYLVFKFLDKDLQKAVTFKRPFLLNTTNKLTGKDLFDRICRFILVIHFRYESLTENEIENRFMVLREKIKQQNIFNIFMAYGTPKEVTNNLIYPQRQQIFEETNINELLVKYNYVVEFQIHFAKIQSYTFNSFKTYYSNQGWADHSYSSQKTGFEESYTLEECFQEMKKSEKLLEGNEVFCSHCCDLKLAEKKMEMYKASKYLVIQLRRFKQIGYEKSKNYAEVVYSQYLDLSKYLLNYQMPEVYLQQLQQSKQVQQQQQKFYYKPKYPPLYTVNKLPKYRLYAVANHLGSLNGGHYTAYSRCDNKWYKFDDSSVSELGKQEWNSGNDAYLLFYERIQNESEWKPQLSSSGVQAKHTKKNKDSYKEQAKEMQQYIQKDVQTLIANMKINDHNQDNNDKKMKIQ